MTEQFDPTAARLVCENAQRCGFMDANQIMLAAALDELDELKRRAEATERELRAEIAKLQGTILACHRAFRGGSAFVQLEARRMASEVFSQTFPHKATLDELNCLRKAVAAKREVQR